MRDVKEFLHLYLGGDNPLGFQNNFGYVEYLQPGSYEQFRDAGILGGKPILRPLSDMTEEEKVMLCCMNLDPPWQPGHIIQTNEDDIAAMRIFDMQGDSKSLYIPKKRIEPKNFLWLLSKHFDLFNLHEDGLCLYKEDLK